MECYRNFTKSLLSTHIVQVGLIASPPLGWLRINSTGSCEDLNLASNFRFKQFLREAPRKNCSRRSLWSLKAMEEDDLKMTDPLLSENQAGLDEMAIEIDSSYQVNTASVEDWRKALDKVIPAVVVLKITTCRAFDTESAGASSATGFVVDKRRGIILTNRHVIKPGPVIAEAVFLNREEVPVRPIYRDPVHDFGFLHYDPGAIKSLNYEEIPLAPEAACVGLEIRVVGNDSGEKVSIMSGTIARLDRDAPRYSMNGYNDFNVFYMQAASGTKGGSSGSPVIDCVGRAVGMNAGGKSAGASAFFLPLERVVRALQFIQVNRDRNIDDWDAASIPRGALQVTFLHKGFDELRRLGLQSETEKMVRHASPHGETGMLVVESLVPGGPGSVHLQPGDILVRVNEEVITRFLNLEILLDDNVNQKIKMQIERGGTSLTIQLLVQNLHSVTPNYFLEVCAGVIHPLSYQQARNFHFPCGLVYVADPGYMLSKAGVPRYAIIKKFAGRDVSTVEDFIVVLSKVSKDVQVPLEYITHKDRHRIKYALVTVDQHEWHAPPLIFTRNDSTGLWSVELAFNPCHFSHTLGGSDFGGLTKKTVKLKEASKMGHHHLDNFEELTDGITNLKISYDDVSEVASIQSEAYEGAEKHLAEEGMINDRRVVASLSSDGTSEAEENNPNGLPHSTVIDHEYSTAGEANGSSPRLVIQPSLVMCEVHVPVSCLFDGVTSKHSLGTGVIVYHKEDMGLVAVDQTKVAISAVDVMLSFAAFPIEITGKVVFLHPTHNYALITYDPSALGPIGVSAVRAAELFPESSLKRGDPVYLVGMSGNLQIKSKAATVTNPCAAVRISSGQFPRGRPILMEVIELDADFGPAISGVLSDKQGRVHALWGNFSFVQQKRIKEYVRGIPIYTICAVVDKIISGASGPSLLMNGTKRPTPLVRILEAELYPRLLSKARSFGLSDNWIQALVRKDPERRIVLRVKGCFAGSEAENSLEQGDMILAIDKEPVTCLRDIENALRFMDESGSKDGKLHMTIFRQGRELDVLVGTDIKDGNGTTRVVNWCGCLVQEPNPAVRALGFLPEEGHGVYVTMWSPGSPAHRYGLYALQWIVEVNGKSTPDLDTFVDVVKGLEHGKFVRIKTINLKAKPGVMTLKQDLHYWPTWELRFNPDTAVWHRTLINSLEGGSM